MLYHSAKRRLHLHSIETMPGGIDEEIADLFREMREALGLSTPEIAAQLKTHPAVVDALEQGKISALPPWPETSQVVLRYTELLDLDADPVLRRIMLQLPPDHPRRPKTEQVASQSYDNLRSNVEAALQRVPSYHQPVERESLPLQPPPLPPQQYQRPPSRTVQPRERQRPPMPQQRQQPPTHQPAPPIRPQQRQQPALGQGNFRAAPPSEQIPYPSSGQIPAHGPEKRKKKPFLGLLQFFLLLILLASGYAVWLAMNDPQGFENLKVALNSGLQALVEQISQLIK
jgi:transcriptional regulator with XRE-family HTH domain